MTRHAPGRGGAPRRGQPPDAGRLPSCRYQLVEYTYAVALAPPPHHTLPCGGPYPLACHESFGASVLGSSISLPLVRFEHPQRLVTAVFPPPLRGLSLSPLGLAVLLASHLWRFSIDAAPREWRTVVASAVGLKDPLRRG